MSLSSTLLSALTLITVSMSQYRSNLCHSPAFVFPNTLPLKNHAEFMSLCMVSRLMSSVLTFVTSSTRRKPASFIAFLCLIILVFSWLFFIFKRTGLSIPAFPGMRFSLNLVCSIRDSSPS